MHRSNPIVSRPAAAQPPRHVRKAEHQEGIILTDRETEVLQWSAAGKSSWEIGQIVNCSEAGVNYHFCNIRRKFGVSSRWTAVVKALEQGLIHLP
jgi:LuxR family quorum-sensing transcriptional regulator LasR